MEQIDKLWIVDWDGVSENGLSVWFGFGKMRFVDWVMDGLVWYVDLCGTDKDQCVD